MCTRQTAPTSTVLFLEFTWWGEPCAPSASLSQILCSLRCISLQEMPGTNSSLFCGVCLESPDILYEPHRGESCTYPLPPYPPSRPCSVLCVWWSLRGGQRPKKRTRGNTVSCCPSLSPGFSFVLSATELHGGGVGGGVGWGVPICLLILSAPGGQSKSPGDCLPHLWAPRSPGP